MSPRRYKPWTQEKEKRGRRRRKRRRKRKSLNNLRVGIPTKKLVLLTFNFDVDNTYFIF
ncbi:MAG: hypothetical protein JSV09_13155 [Thermoplasmata archaeon]|nr:MAG: hypothetical protein JSV09_13155 [Thermoplasmata archaeon]